MLPRNSVLIKELSNAIGVPISVIESSSLQTSEKFGVPVRKVLSTLFEHHIIDKNECNVCLDPFGAGVIMVKCPKCNAEVCTRCLVNNMKSTKTLVCTNSRSCDMVFDDFTLASLIPEEILKRSVFPAIKEVIWHQKQDFIQNIVARVNATGFTKSEIPNPAREEFYEEHVKPRKHAKEAIDGYSHHLQLLLAGTRSRCKLSSTQIITKLKEKLELLTGKVDVKGYASEFLAGIMKELCQWVSNSRLVDHSDFRIYLAHIAKVCKEENTAYKSIVSDHKTIPTTLLVDVKGNITIPTEEEKEKVASSSFVVRCPYEGCKGYLTKHFACMVCSRKICGDCHVKLNSESDNMHVCNNVDVESVKAIMESTRPCPGCGARVERTWGCDHMFCIGCKTGFDWESGKVISDKVNTNPLLKKWKEEQHNNNSNSVDIVSAPEFDGEIPPLPDFSILIAKFRATNSGSIHSSKRVYDFLMAFRDLLDPVSGGNGNIGRFYDLPEHTVRNHELAYNNQPQERHTERFIAGLITEKKLKDIFFREHRVQQRHNSNRLAIEHLENEGRKILHNYIYTDNTASSSSIIDVVYAIDELRRSTNDKLNATRKAFGYSYGLYITRELIIDFHSNDYESMQEMMLITESFSHRSYTDIYSMYN